MAAAVRFETVTEPAQVGTTTRTVNEYDAADVLVRSFQIQIEPTKANEATIRSRANQALAANATFLALANPTNAQNAAQVKALTRECSALIRLLLGALDDVSDT